MKLSGKVVVIGGGNVAIDVARTAIRENAEAVSMYCLESDEEMPALTEEINGAKSEEISINNGWGPKRIISKNGKVTGVEFKKCTQVFDNGKFAPKYDDNITVTVEADHVLISVGQSIDWKNLLDGSTVELNQNSTAKADGFTYQTNAPDVFVGGDVYTGPKFAIDAISAGKQAAISLHRFVQPGQSLIIGRDRREYKAVDKDNLDRDAIVLGFDNTPRQKAGHSPEKEKTFKDSRETFTEEQLKKETARCLGCGAVQLDEYMCIGCGQCTTKCEFDAVHLVRRNDEYAHEFAALPIQVAKYAVKRAANIAKSEITSHIKK